MSDWAVEVVPEHLRRFQHGVAEMLLGERRVAYLSSKVIGEGHAAGGVWVQEDTWTLQLREAAWATYGWDGLVPW